MRSPLPFGPILLLSACIPAGEAPQPVAPPQPTPVAALPPAPPVAADWRDWPLTPGQWRYARSDPDRSAATFGAGPDGDLLQIGCDTRRRQVTLAVTGAPEASPLTVRTSTTTRVLPTVVATHADGQPPITRDIRLAANDPLLDAVAFSRGHFTVEEAGRPALVLPAHPEIGRVIEDCRA